MRQAHTTRRSFAQIASAATGKKLQVMTIRRRLKGGNLLTLATAHEVRDEDGPYQDLLVDLVSGLNPTNAQQLLSGLQLTYNGPKHMRLVRNSIAHLSTNGVGEVKRILVHYRGATFLHPLDLLHWEEPASGEPAFLVWLSELLEIGESMVQ